MVSPRSQNKMPPLCTRLEAVCHRPSRSCSRQPRLVSLSGPRVPTKPGSWLFLVFPVPLCSAGVVPCHLASAPTCGSLSTSTAFSQDPGREQPPYPALPLGQTPTRPVPLGWDFLLCHGSLWGIVCHLLGYELQEGGSGREEEHKYIFGACCLPDTMLGSHRGVHGVLARGW